MILSLIGTSHISEYSQLPLASQAHLFVAQDTTSHLSQFTYRFLHFLFPVDQDNIGRCRRDRRSTGRCRLRRERAQRDWL